MLSHDTNVYGAEGGGEGGGASGGGLEAGGFAAFEYVSGPYSTYRVSQSVASVAYKQMAVRLPKASTKKPVDPGPPSSQRPLFAESQLSSPIAAPGPTSSRGPHWRFCGEKTNEIG